MAAISRLFLWWLCSFCIVSFAISENSHSDSFTEELFIKPLSSGHVYNYFLFTTRWKIGNEKETCRAPIGLSLLFFCGHNIATILFRKLLERCYCCCRSAQSNTFGCSHSRWGKSWARSTSKSCIWLWRRAGGGIRNGATLSRRHLRARTFGPGSTRTSRGK